MTGTTSDTVGTDVRRDPPRADILGSSDADAVRAMDTANVG